MTHNGCPVCGWSGDVAKTYDRSHRYYTHVVEQEGELLHGRTCTERTRPEKVGLVTCLARTLQGIVR